MQESHNNQKKIAVINDYSGFGRCSIAVALPIISVMKVQCCPVPTSIFSNHTGFESFYYEDFTGHMQRYIDEWKKLELQFDGICTGFLGSSEQISIVERFLEDFKRQETKSNRGPGDGRLRKTVSDLHRGNVSADKETGAVCRYHYTEYDGSLYPYGYAIQRELAYA